MNDPTSVNLGPGLRRLVEQVKSPLVGAQDIKTLPVNDSRRGTFHLGFENGLQLKGRYYVSTLFAQIARRIHDAAGLEFLPRVVAHEDDAMLEEWIDGKTASEPLDPLLVRQSGQMQGRLHRCALPSLADLDFKPMQVADWLLMMTRRLATLIDGNVLTELQARRLQEMATAHAPADHQAAIVNRDLCPENLVMDKQGRLFLVDNGSLTVGSIQEDLCRTWYRWPMTPAQRKAFCLGYGEFGNAANFENPSLFWRIVVVVNSASFRLKVSPAAAAAALQRLEPHLRPA